MIRCKNNFMLDKGHRQCSQASKGQKPFEIDKLNVGNKYNTEIFFDVYFFTII